MTNKVQKIKQEIERLKEHTAKCGYPGQGEFENGNREGRNWVCDKLLSFIDSLPEEPASEDLEEEIGKYTTNHLLKKRNHSTGVYHLTQKDCDDIAHHFAEWQREKDIKLEKIDDLEEFAQKWAYSNYHKELDGVNCDCLYSGVIKGAEWQKQQMKEALQTEYEKGRFDMREEIMKEAVEADVIVDRIGEVVYLCPHTSEKTGDKVKIIIVKTEQQ